MLRRESLIILAMIQRLLLKVTNGEDAVNRGVLKAIITIQTQANHSIQIWTISLLSDLIGTTGDQMV